MEQEFEKLSKSDTTPEMEAKAEEFRLAMLANKCQHFAVGTWIMSKNRRGKILEEGVVRTGVRKGMNLLLIRWEDGSLGFVAPHALNRR